MTLIIKIICPSGIITASDTREVYSKLNLKTKKRERFAHNDGIKKSFSKGKFSLAIAGNAFIGENKLKDIFPDFINTLPEKLNINILEQELSKLYKEITLIPSTKYYISFYDLIDENSKYKDSFKYEPHLCVFDTKTMKIKRINADEDGFNYGFFWGGENSKIAESLKIKRSKIDANRYDLKKSIELIKEIFQEISNSFKENNEYSSISENFDLTIQTPLGMKIIKNYKE